MKFLHTVMLVTVVLCSFFIMSGCKGSDNTLTSEKTTWEQSEPPVALPSTPQAPITAPATPEPTVVIPEQAVAKPKKAAEPEYKAVEGGQPAILFEKTTYKLGKMEPNKYYNAEFKFKNVGTATLEIIRTHATCGCTVPKLDKKIYAPGESGVIKVRYRAQKSAGSVNKAIDVYTNDPRNDMIKCRLIGFVELSVSIEPKTLSLSLKEPNAGAKPITLKSTNGKEFSIDSVKDYTKVFSFDIDPNKKAKEFTLTPKVDIDALAKKHKGTLVIQTKTPQVSRLRVNYAAPPIFGISKARIVIQKADPAKPQEKEVWITSNYGDKVNVESTKSNNNIMEVVKQETKGNRVRLVIKVSPPEPGKSKKRHFSDQMQIKVTGAKPMTIFCTGLYAPGVLKQ